jgi:hypothetical protein
MPQLDLNQLDDDARIWIFGISPALDAAQSARMLQQVDAFLGEWAAHNVPVTSARALRDGTFLIVAVDKETEQSGCSIDRMFGLLRQFERDFGVAILDPNRVFVRGAGDRVHAVTRAEFRDSGDPHTIVFDTLAERLGDVRSGRWVRKAEESWHRGLLRRTA